MLVHVNLSEMLGNAGKKYPQQNQFIAHFSLLVYFYLLSSLPVVRRGESCHHYIPPIDVNDIGHSLQDVEVEMGVARDGAVQARL